MFTLRLIFCLLIFLSVSAHAFGKSVFLASETTNKPNFDLIQTDNRLDQRFTFESTHYYIQPYLGVHLQKSDSNENQYDDEKKGLQIGINFRLPYEVFLRAEHRFQKHIFGSENADKNREESRYGIYYYKTDNLPWLVRLSWEFYGESFYIPEIYKKSSASLFWARTHYLIAKRNYTPTFYLEAAAAENPTLDFGESYQELRPGVRIYKAFSKSSIQFLVFKNILPDATQDLRAILAIYGDWPWKN